MQVGDFTEQRLRVGEEGGPHGVDRGKLPLQCLAARGGGRAGHVHQHRNAVLVADFARDVGTEHLGGEAGAGEVDAAEELLLVLQRGEQRGHDARVLVVVAQLVEPDFGAFEYAPARAHAPLSPVGRAHVRPARDAEAGPDDELRTRADHIAGAEIAARRRQLVWLEGELVIAHQAERRRDLQLQRGLRHRQQDVLDLGARHEGLGGIGRALRAGDIGEEQALAPCHHLVAQLEAQLGAADRRGAVDIGIEQLGAMLVVVLRRFRELVERAAVVDREWRVVRVGAAVGPVVEDAAAQQRAKLAVAQVGLAQQRHTVGDQVAGLEVAVAVIAVDVGRAQQRVAAVARAHRGAVGRGDAVVERGVAAEVDGVAGMRGRREQRGQCGSGGDRPQTAAAFHWAAWWLLHGGLPLVSVVVHGLALRMARIWPQA
ncbi:hypothetical protein D9M70_427430 [compost metagenome]